jgi:hypothetical protein
MPQPPAPKIYHIVHVDRLPSIITDRFLWSDAEVLRRSCPGTTIGMDRIKQRRLYELSLASHPGLHVGSCVPFYFCPRSIMLYLISRANNPDLSYQEGQEPIVHLESDLYQAVAWAEENHQRWAFTLSNAGAHYFDDYATLAELNKIDWAAVKALRWSGNDVLPSVKEGKQAEFLMEKSFPWELVCRIGVASSKMHWQVLALLSTIGHRPQVEIKTDWYY